MATPSGKKGSNRVKGNLKPSSSSQAVKLLSDHESGCIGFGVSASQSFVPLKHLLDDVDSLLDTEILLVLRKLSKRDTTTKIKALQELGEICSMKNPEVIKSILPFWPKLYNKLAMDIDYRVREAVQQTFLILTSKVGKEIAPYLKYIIGCWVVSQCDTYPTVSSSAVKVFQRTFPGDKENSALTLYRRNIFDHLANNLIVHSPQSLSDAKTTSLENMENKYNRILASSLSGSRKLIQSLPTDKLSTLKPSLETLFENGKFWKHGKSTLPAVKAGFYSVLAITSQRFPEIVSNFLCKIAPLVLHNLDVSNLVVIGEMWESILSLVSYIPDSWHHVSWNKAFWPKLRKCLESGCSGNASTVSPNIMPLLSKIPENLSGDKNIFYCEFLTSFQKGFKHENILKSNIEYGAFIRSFMECCLFMLSQTITHEENNHLSQIILDKYVLEFMKSSIDDDIHTSLSPSPLYSCIADILFMLETSSNGFALSKMFWNQMQEFVCSHIHGHPKAILILIKGVFDSISSKKKSVNINLFGEQKKQLQIDSEINASKRNVTDNFFEFYSNVVFHVFTNLKTDQNSDANLSLLAQLFQIFINDSILSKLMNYKERTTDNMFVCFFNSICLPLLKTCTASKVNSEYIISISFNCLERIEDLSYFSKLIDSCDRLVQYCVILEMLTERYKYDSKARIFLKTPALRNMILCLVKQTCILSNESSDVEVTKQLEIGWSVITTVVSSCGTFDSVYDSEFVESVLCAIRDQFSSLNEITNTDTLNQDIYFITRAACSFFDNLTDILCPTVTEELLTILFTISLNPIYHLENCEVAWTKGLKLLTVSQKMDWRNGVFITQTYKMLRTAALSAEPSIPHFNRLWRYTELILNVVFDNVEDCTDILNKFTITNRINDRYSAILNYIYVTGRFLSISSCVFSRSTSGSIDLSCNISHDLISIISVSILNLKLLQFMITHSTKHLQSLRDTIIDCLLDVFRSMAVANILFEYENTSTEALFDIFNNLKRLLTQVICSLRDFEKKNVLQTAIDKSENHGEMESVMLRCMLEFIVPEYCYLNETQMIDRWTYISAETLHHIQAVVPFLSSKTVHDLMASQITIFLTLLNTSNEWLWGRCLGVISTCMRTLYKLPETKLGTVLIVKSALAHILNWRERHEHFLICSDDDLSDVLKVSRNIEIMRFLALVVQEVPEQLSDKEWDFILCCLVEWVQRIKILDCVEPQSVLLMTYVSTTCDLLFNVSLCVTSKVQSSKCFPDSLFTEWSEFFSEGIFGILIPLYIAVASKETSNRLSMFATYAIGRSLSLCSKKHILNHKLPTYLSVDNDALIEPNIQTFLNHTCPFLLSTQISVQVTAYTLLKKIMCAVNCEVQKPGNMTENSEEACSKSPPKVLIDIIRNGGDALDLWLNDTHEIASVTIESNSEEHRFAYGYVLSWKLILQLFKSANPQMRAMYAAYLRDNGLFSKFLKHLFHLFPCEQNMRTMAYALTKNTTIDVERKCSDLQQQAFRLYYQCLETTPALVRQWWMGLDRKMSVFVDKFTSKYVSPILITDEISAVHPSSNDLEGMTIKPKPASREVIAVYIMAEVKIVVTITLPENFPLGAIAVCSDKRVGATQAQWDRWLLQLNIFLQHQNGTIIDGLKLWKKNIDRRFDGVEDCMICYSVLHGTTFQLPKLQCRTCKKKYHSACLYKWFSTSMNSTCPLCRNLF